ncbi:putative SPEF1 family protein [Monocercomonoides exilis]|uniref:putative SPEF1 family protein n=1 Tax=Monocercomonoides exilis TaxID=2049356 RepID=UPI003559B682|nr:putative SPEF1 family protein [Monocercomonoides exilis]|eukprot:MONOS_2850.1-p1 / transcript=MONOS_2850.1 / gene=MONOS_2850 / organism=Monocercomonoides_exilis_PA203 / gene_product=SPEF1 family protein / transcript_product=SPEF1 family protein / location=Mono_scaffold00061:146794-148089(+) / protein_length=268 / sequence_SO=supercontig / SO=protein_coding / is_pseudo=false
MMDLFSLDSETLSLVYEWVDSIALSRPKQNIARDFSDGVLMAEVCKACFPKLVDLHNYSPANALSKKIYNWQTLNEFPPVKPISQLSNEKKQLQEALQREEEEEASKISSPVKDTGTIQEKSEKSSKSSGSHGSFIKKSSNPIQKQIINSSKVSISRSNVADQKKLDSESKSSGPVFSSPQRELEDKVAMTSLASRKRISHPSVDSLHSSITKEQIESSSNDLLQENEILSQKCKALEEQIERMQTIISQKDKQIAILKKQVSRNSKK